MLNNFGEDLYNMYTCSTCNCRTCTVVHCTVLQDMVASVSSLLKIVRNVEDEAGRGVKTLENAIDAIKEELKVSLSLLVVRR